MNARSDDEELVLSDSTLAALQQFYSERENEESKFENLKATVERKVMNGQLSMSDFTEDWNASQFWYNDETASTLARQLLDGATNRCRIAVISAPSAFVQIKNMLAADTNVPEICLLEFDQRFDVLPGFVQYDFQHPLRLPNEMKGKYDRLLCDPPFLSEDCQTKAAMTARWLLRDQPKRVTGADTDTRIIVCTGERMESLIHKLYPVRTTNFEPKHAQDRLSNDFRCYANFEGSAWSWQ